jgi:acetylornithine/succinyldiaminopimelate/putrescine aminotransferase
MRAERHPDLIADVRGRGLIQAMEFRRPLPDLADWLLDHGVLVIVAAGRVLRLLPPFVVEQADIDEFFGLLDQYLQQAARQ